MLTCGTEHQCNITVIVLISMDVTSIMVFNKEMKEMAVIKQPTF